MNGRLPILLLFALSGCRSSASAVLPEARADDTARGAGQNGIAVVELFTSEGCSSCPPADGVLGSLVRANPRVYALAFHVDYWDELGWPDRFASHDATARQRAYGRSFGTWTVYTPEMIVGGTDAFTGSDRIHADASIERSLAHAAPLRASVRARPAGPHEIAVDFEAPGAPADAVFGVAVVQREATTNVRAGENAGRTLHHANVVRSFAVAPSAASSLTLQLPESLRPSEGEVIVIVQQKSGPAGGMPILGAARAALPDAIHRD
jgi:hypothetical protein